MKGKDRLCIDASEREVAYSLDDLLSTSGSYAADLISGRRLPAESSVRRVLADTKHLFLTGIRAVANGDDAYRRFIGLFSCLHWLAMLFKGSSEHINGPEFKRFCRKYLLDYDAEALWRNGRNGLFHLGVPQRRKSAKGVELTHRNPALHDPDGSKGNTPGSITLDLGSFAADIGRAAAKLVEDAEADAGLRDKVLQTYNGHRLVRHERVSGQPMVTLPLTSM